jgi:isopenicillin N synthase-like dioxygenase
LKAQTPTLFDLPDAVEQGLAMENRPFFTGYTDLGKEITAKKSDGKEQFDFAHEHSFESKDGDENWKKMRGPNTHLFNQY